MVFRVLTEHTDEHCLAIANDLIKRGFHFIELREADIEENGTNEKVGECYSLTVKGSWLRYLKLKKDSGLPTHIWEGYKTLG